MEPRFSAQAPWLIIVGSAVGIREAGAVGGVSFLPT